MRLMDALRFETAGEAVFLAKATDLGDRLLPAFSSGDHGLAFSGNTIISTLLAIISTLLAIMSAGNAIISTLHSIISALHTIISTLY